MHAIPLFLDAKILSVSSVYYRSAAVSLHDIHTNSAPKNLVNLFVNVSDVHTHSTRSSAANSLYRKHSILNYNSIHFKFMVRNCGTRFQPH